MKDKLTALSRRYLAALRQHLKLGPRANLRTARGLGEQAVTIGLETLDLARIHELALINLGAVCKRRGILKRAEIFFNEAVTLIEKTHQAALHAHRRLRQLSKTLGQRTINLAASNRSLKRGMVKRKAVEGALKKSAAHSEQLLKESLHLEKHLQRLTHKLFSGQEEHRKRASLDLKDEIAQTLLGINVRLLILKQESGLNIGRLEKRIASTQRLVNISAKSIERFTHNLVNPNEA